jgi:hypothetical protein
MGLLHPKLARFPFPEEAPLGTKRHDELLAEIEQLSRQHDDLKRQVKVLLRRERTHGRKMAGHYKEQREALERDLEEVRDRLDRAKEAQAKLIYEAKERQQAKRRRRELRRERREREAMELDRASTRLLTPPEEEESGGGAPSTEEGKGEGD